MGTATASFEETIEKLEQTRRMLDRDRMEAARQLRQAEEEQKKAARLRAELEVRLEKAEDKARREAQRILEEARAVSEDTFRELDRMRSQRNEEADHQRVNEARRLCAGESTKPAKPWSGRRRSRRKGPPPAR